MLELAPVAAAGVTWKINVNPQFGPIPAPLAVAEGGVKAAEAETPWVPLTEECTAPVLVGATKMTPAWTVDGLTLA